jgi:hypothetical protein
MARYHCIRLDESALAPHSLPFKPFAYDYYSRAAELSQQIKKMAGFSFAKDGRSIRLDVACIKRYLRQGLQTARSCGPNGRRRGLRRGINDPHESECHRSCVPGPSTFRDRPLTRASRQYYGTRDENMIGGLLGGKLAIKSRASPAPCG